MVIHELGIAHLWGGMLCMSTLLFNTNALEKLLTNSSIEDYLCPVGQMPNLKRYCWIFTVLAYVIPFLFGVGRLLVEIWAAESSPRVIATWIAIYVFFEGALCSFVFLFVIIGFVAIGLVRRVEYYVHQMQAGADGEKMLKRITWGKQYVRQKTPLIIGDGGKVILGKYFGSD